jgi:hypothetical protein
MPFSPSPRQSAERPVGRRRPPPLRYAFLI